MNTKLTVVFVFSVLVTCSVLGLANPQNSKNNLPVDSDFSIFVNYS